MACVCAPLVSMSPVGMCIGDRMRALSLSLLLSLCPSPLPISPSLPLPLFSRSKARARYTQTAVNIQVPDILIRIRPSTSVARVRESAAGEVRRRGLIGKGMICRCRGPHLFFLCELSSWWANQWFAFVPFFLCAFLLSFHISHHVHVRVGLDGAFFFGIICC